MDAQGLILGPLENQKSAQKHILTLPARHLNKIILCPSKANLENWQSTQSAQANVHLHAEDDHPEHLIGQVAAKLGSTRLASD